MAKINPHFSKLSGGYVFVDIARRVAAFKQENPGIELIRLGIGDTTEPLAPRVIEAMHEKVQALASAETYTGYGNEQGDEQLRQALVAHYAELGVDISPADIFISDGAKTDAANIQAIFAADSIVAVQDPVYPVYVDAAVIGGRTGKATNGRYSNVVYLPCLPENGFIPSVPDRPVDLLYLCSPNNPTGAVVTHEQLAAFVAYARKNRAVIIFDAAYASFITDSTLPRSIYEVPGAKECAIEINSFSKWAGFTGVRLGWTIVPHELVVEGSGPGDVRQAWHRRQSTMFNGASNIAQAGGLAVLSPKGQRQAHRTVDYYMRNAELIRQSLDNAGFTAYGGVNAPYIWAKTPNNLSSWELFDWLLEHAHVVCTPGVAFGPGGEGYVRFSAFGHREAVERAARNISSALRTHMGDMRPDWGLR
jgi:LL-diaminopimelate aminotransferase